MVNKRKVRLMARTAMYEKHEGSTQLKHATYYRSDYVGMHMLFAGIGMTVAYMLILLLICVYKFEYLVNHLTVLNYSQIASTALVIYVLLLIAFQVIAYFVFSFRYSDSQNGVRLYLNRLKKINKLNNEEKDSSRREEYK